jgi:arylformamidase
MITEMIPWIDITRPIYPGMPVWPGDPPIVEEPVSRIADGDSSNVTRFLLGSHTGTHIDAPRHFEPSGACIDALNPDALMGPCLVLDLASGQEHIARADLERIVNVPVERLLIRTRNSFAEPTVFHKDFVALLPDAAGWIVEQGIRLIGVDGPSVEEYGSSDFPVHHALLRAGVVIVEVLDLSRVAAGDYDLFCAPLKWAGADGAPARAFLRKC